MPDPLNMASSGKKGKKSKGKTLPLNHFLQDTAGVPAPIPLRKPTTNWADEVEDSYDSYDGGRSNKITSVVLPTAPKAARGLDDFSDKIPQNPPFIAYLSNLPYDIEEDEIADFFRNLKISNMRIPKEDRGGEGIRVKGFGYVEFEDQASLIEALAKPTCQLKNRRIRIEVATNSENDRRRGGGRMMEMNRDRSDRPEVSTGDWRSGGRKEPESSERRGGGGGGGFNRDRGEGFNRDREGGFSRDRGEGGGFNRDRNEGGFNRDRNEGGFTRDRGEGGFSRDRESAPERSGAWRDNTDRPSFRDNDRDKGMQRDRYERDGDRRGGGGGFGPRRMDREERNGGFQRGSRDENRDGDRSELRTRPRLNLAPRTIPIEEMTPVESENAPPVVKTAPVPAASIFGNAKPVDTTARERQIEERLAKLNTELDNKNDDRRRDDRKRSPERKRYSPPRRSPDQRRDSPELSRGSPEPRRASPERKRASPDRRRAAAASPRRGSPDRRRTSPNRGGHPPRKTDDKRGPPPRNDTKAKDKNERRPPREFTERDMPKLKTPEPVNIVNTNQYSYLGNESD